MPQIHLRTVTICGKVIAAAKDRMPGDPDSPMEFLNAEDYQGTQIASLEAGPWTRRMSWICDDCPATEVERPGASRPLFIFPDTCPKVIGKNL